MDEWVCTVCVWWWESLTVIPKSIPAPGCWRHEYTRVVYFCETVRDFYSIFCIEIKFAWRLHESIPDSFTARHGNRKNPQFNICLKKRSLRRLDLSRFWTPNCKIAWHIYIYLWGFFKLSSMKNLSASETTFVRWKLYVIYYNYQWQSSALGA